MKISTFRQIRRVVLGAVLVGGVLGLIPQFTYAGVFNLPRFVAPGEFGLGIEPELTMNDNAALGINLRYIQGLTELNNFTGIIGTGSGDRQFRVGGAFTFDFFPDVDKQPGIGLALQALYVNLRTAGSVEISAIPYIHKYFKTTEFNAEPFFAVPVGLSLSDGRYQTQINLVFGSFFQHSEHIRSIVELGVSVNNSYTYVSGGVVYYH